MKSVFAGWHAVSACKITPKFPFYQLHPVFFDIASRMRVLDCVLDSEWRADLCVMSMWRRDVQNVMRYRVGC